MGAFRKKFNVYRDGQLIEQNVNIEKVSELSGFTISTCRQYLKNMLDDEAVSLNDITVCLIERKGEKHRIDNFDTDAWKKEWDLTTQRLRTVFNNF